MLSIREAAAALEVPWELTNPSIHIQGASIDSRRLEPGNLFVAIHTEKDDGHRYLEDAFRKGASGALIRRQYFEEHRVNLLEKPGLFQNLLLTENPVQALTSLAGWYRRRFQVKTAAITGSVGKTSTKEMLTYLLKTQAPTFSNPGNLNNHLGLPISLLTLQASHRFGAVEVGASRAGDIEPLVKLLEPEVGILTQVSPAHLAGFGSLRGIYDTKCELFQGIVAGGVVILPENDNLLVARAERLGLRVLRVGYSAQADYSVTKVRLEGAFVTFELNQKWHFKFPGSADFLAKNAAMAVAAAGALGIPCEALPKIWDGLILPQGRFQERRYAGDIRIIDDSYNASPQSFGKALHQFARLPVEGRRILFISDMLELGDQERYYHESLGRQIARLGFDEVVGYGSRTKWLAEVALREAREPGRIKYFEKFDEAAEYLIQQTVAHDNILIKASRGMAADRVIPLCETKLGAPIA